MSEPIHRRVFLHRAARTAAVGAILNRHPAVGAEAASQAATQPASRPALEWRNKQPTMSYIQMGRTRFMSSRFVFGAGGLGRGSDDLRLLEIALDRGVNYIDTGRAYRESESAIADLARKHRERMFIVSKAGHIGWPDMTIQPGQDAKAAKLYTDQLEESLRQLRVETIDCYMVQGVEHDWVVTMDALYEAFAKARQAGKVRFFGLATHTNIRRVCELAAESGRYDLIMLAVNPNSLQDLRPTIRTLHEAGIGLVSMKVSGPIRANPNVYHEHYKGVFADQKLSAYQQAYAYMLFRGQIDAFIAHIGNRQMLEEDLAVPTLKLGQAQLDAMEKRVLADTRGACRHCGTCTRVCPQGLDAMEKRVLADTRGACRHCGTCTRVCPQGVNVADQLRYFAYWQVYGQGPQAKRMYERYGRALAERCAGCQTCRRACPEAIDLPAVIDRLCRDLAHC